jgi:CO/xanthine dehydrogenase FAD-binding subunit
VGHIPSPDLIASVAMHATRHEIEPSGDIHATADYRRHLAFVLGKRAIERAVSRARDGLSHE